MYKNVNRTYWAIAALCFVISSCGNNIGTSSSLTQFRTSYATALAATPRLEADLLKGNTCPDSGVGTIISESVDFTINTTANGSSTIKPLPISITGYTVTYTPKNAGTPALTALTNSYGVTITPGMNATIPVDITTDKQKLAMMNANQWIPCSLNVYQYDVSVSFHATEIGGSNGDITAGLVMAMADLNNN